MTYDKNKSRQVPEWARIEIQYDPCASLDDYDDECITDEFRRKVEDGQAWWVGIIVHDNATDECDSLWGIDTEDMCETHNANANYDLDEHGWEIAQDLIMGLARGRQDRLRSHAETLRRRALALQSEADMLDIEIVRVAS